MDDFAFVSRSPDGSYSLRAEDTQASFAMQSVQLQTHIPTVAPSQNRLYCSQGLRPREGCREVGIQLVEGHSTMRGVESFVFPLGVNGATFEVSRGELSAPVEYICRTEHPIGRILPSRMSLVAGGCHIPWATSFTVMDSHTLLFPAESMPDGRGIGNGSPGFLLCRTIGHPEEVSEVLNGWLRVASCSVSRPTVEFGYDRQSGKATLSVASPGPGSRVSQVVVRGDALVEEMGLMGTAVDVGSTAAGTAPWAVGMQMGRVQPGFYSHSAGAPPFYVGESGAPLDIAEEVRRALNPMRLRGGVYGTLQLPEENPIEVQIPSGDYTPHTMRQVLGLILCPLFEAHGMHLRVCMRPGDPRLQLESSHAFRFSCEELGLSRMCPLARVQVSGSLPSPRLSCTCVVEEHPHGGMVIDHAPYVVDASATQHPWQLCTPRAVAFCSGDVVQLRASAGDQGLVAVVESIDVVDCTASCALHLRPNGYQWDWRGGRGVRLSHWHTPPPELYGSPPDSLPASSLGMSSFDLPWPIGSNTGMWAPPTDLLVLVYTGRSTTGTPWAKVRAQDGSVVESNAITLARQFRLEFRSSEDRALAPEEVRAGIVTLRFA